MSGCLATKPTTGGGSTTAVSGAAAGGTATGTNGKIDRCPETLGTLPIEENTGAPWYSHYSSNLRLGSTVPLLRTMIQQSNCFVIVERERGVQGKMARVRSAGSCATWCQRWPVWSAAHA